MIRYVLMLICCLFWMPYAAAQAVKPVIDLRGVDPELRVEPTEVMVLGSAHISRFRELEPSDLDPLLERLVEYAPDIVTIEAVSGEVCEMMFSFPSEYPTAYDQYCYDMRGPRAESGLDAAEGTAKARSFLSDWPSAPTTDMRRELAAAFLAANEPHSALVQWLSLPEDQRVTGDGLGVISAAFLDRLSSSMNESVQIAVRLAVRLGHNRVFNADDHSADRILTASGPELWERMRAIWNAREPIENDGFDVAASDIAEGRVLAAYRFYNSAEVQRRTVNRDFRLAMNDREPGQYGRIYNSWYQAGNLRMVSNIVAAESEEPGARILSVVGLSHKLYFDAYPDLMHDIEVVSTDQVLR